MKSAYISALFVELPGSKCRKESRGRGASKKAAISRAIGALLKQVGRSRWTTLQATITVVDLPADEEKE